MNSDLNHIPLTQNYFAAANSADGFSNRFDSIFTGLNRLYIIKGGPGTGKSRLMQSVADEASKRGLLSECFYCSSDPSSLDGVLIPAMSLGILDGTSPHCCDPKYPGAYDQIINLGDFWKTDRLVEKKKEILEKTDLKAKLFVRVYHYLSAAGMIDHEIQRTIEEALLLDKMKAAVGRIFRDIRPQNDPDVSIRLCDAISMDGPVHFSTFEELSTSCHYLKDKYGISDRYLHYVKDYAHSRGLRTLVSYSPLNPQKENGLFFPSIGLAMVILHDPDKTKMRQHDKIINLDRFVRPEQIRMNRAKLRFSAHCKASMMDGAYDTLAEIKKVHFSIEEIYKDAMDFSRKEKYTAQLLKEIFANS